MWVEIHSPRSALELRYVLTVTYSYGWAEITVTSGSMLVLVMSFIGVWFGILPKILSVSELLGFNLPLCVGCRYDFFVEPDPSVDS